MQKEMDELKKLLTGLLVSSPLRITVANLDRDYCEQVGERIPFRRLGFYSLNDCLCSMPDVLEVLGHGPHAEIVLHVSNKSAHINDLVTKQKIQPKRNPRFGKRPSRPNIRRSFDRSYQNFHTHYNPPPLMSKVVPRPFLRPRFNKMHNENVPSSSSSPQISVVNCNNENIVDECRNPSPPESPISSNGAIPKYKDISVLSVVAPESDIYMSDTDDECDIFDTRVENSSTYSLNDTVESLYSLEDTPRRQYEIKVPSTIQDNLRTLISIHDDGIWCGALPEIYKKMYSKELEYGEYGYRSLINMCMELTDIFHCVRPDTGDFKLYNKQKPLPHDFDKGFKISQMLKDLNDSNTARSSGPALIGIEKCVSETFVYPDHVLELFDEIPRQFLPPDAHENDFIDVSVGEIYDPSKFWIQLHEFTNVLNEMMDDIQNFYTSVDNNYEIPENMITIGLYCVARYNHEYHRAVIVNTMKSVKDRVKVYYIDYGTVSAVNSNTLRFLHQKFASLPQQGIRARLANIYPLTNNTQWTCETSTRFLQLVMQKCLVAHIHRIDYERQIVEVFLADTTGVDDIYINDTLVFEGYAIFTNQEQEHITLEPHATPWVKYIHFFPTFLEIENGAVPSASEMVRLQRTGMLLEQIYPQYFVRENKQDELLSNDIRNTELTQQNTNKNSDKNSVDEANGREEESDILSITPTPLEEWATLLDESVVETNENSVVESPRLIPDDSTESSLTPELVCATPALRPPPGFKILPTSQVEFTTTTHVNLDSGQGTVVTKTTNVCPPNNGQLLQLLLSQPQLGLLPHLNPPCGSILPHISTPNYVPTPSVLDSYMLNLMNEQQIRNCQAQLLANNFNLYLNQFNYLNQQNPFLNQNIAFPNRNPQREMLQQQLYQSLIDYKYLQPYFAQYLLTQQQRLTIPRLGLLCNSLISNIINQTTSGPEVGVLFKEVLDMLTDVQIVESHEMVINTSLKTMTQNSNASVNGTSVSTEQLSQMLGNLNCQNSQNLTHVENVGQNIETRSNERDIRKRRLVIKADLEDWPLHVIWHCKQAYVNVQEVLQVISSTAPIQHIRKQIVMIDPTISIIDLPLSDNSNLFEELARYMKIDWNGILHIIPAESIPQMLKVLGYSCNKLNFTQFLKDVSENSYLWVKN